MKLTSHIYRNLSLLYWIFAHLYINIPREIMRTTNWADRFGSFWLQDSSYFFHYVMKCPEEQLISSGYNQRKLKLRTLWRWISFRSLFTQNLILRATVKTFFYTNTINPLFEIKKMDSNPAEKIHVWINTTFLSKLIQILKNELLLTMRRKLQKLFSAKFYLQGNDIYAICVPGLKHK